MYITPKLFPNLLTGRINMTVMYTPIGDTYTIKTADFSHTKVVEGRRITVVCCLQNIQNTKKLLVVLGRQRVDRSQFYH